MAQPGPAQSFIGSRISLTSMNDIRYRGTLQAIDHVNSTIQLINVVSLGTENRRPAAEYLPPNETLFANIIFRATEVKDLALETGPPAPPPSLPQDPAIIGASRGPVNYPYPQQYDLGNQQHISPQIPPAQQYQQPPPHQQQPHIQAPVPHTNGHNKQQVHSPPARQQNQQQNRSDQYRAQNNNVNSVAATMEKVERSLGDLRVSSGQGNNNGNNEHRPHRERKPRNAGGGGQGQKAEVSIPTTEFDFAKANARFDKAAVMRQQASQYSQNEPAAEEDEEKTNPSDTEQPDNAKEKETEKFYNPVKSFFDNISSDAKNAQQRAQGGGGRGRGGGGGANGGGGGNGAPRGGGGGRRGGGFAKSRREEERDRNVATFGEPGGIGLMGPGAYVHNRFSGGRRPRGRGAPPRQTNG